jgi:hypothetical protein
LNFANSVNSANPVNSADSANPVNSADSANPVNSADSVNSAVQTQLLSFYQKNARTFDNFANLFRLEFRLFKLRNTIDLYVRVITRESSYIMYGFFYKSSNQI